jgi:hypothetical protein
VHLKNVLPNPYPTEMTYLITSLLLALPLLLLRFWYKQDFLHGQLSAAGNQPQLVPEFTQQRTQPEANTITGTSSKQTGTDFQKFVNKLFDRNCFTLPERNTVVMQNEAYPVYSMISDTECNTAGQDKRVEFAVECKWRQDFNNGKLNWSKDYQLLNHRRFNHAKDIPVFVIIGVGGLPSNPEEVFIIPLDRIQSTSLNREQLKPLKRADPRKSFGFSVPQMMLV